MSAEAWIALAGLILSPIAWFIYQFFRDLRSDVSSLRTDLNKVQDNHLGHMELYMKLICEHLGITYHDPKDR